LGKEIAYLSGMRIKKILCAVDFSPVSRRTVRYAADLAKSHDSALRLLHVVTPFGFESDDFPIDVATVTSSVEKQARRELAKLQKLAEQAGAATESVMCVGVVQREILKAVQEFNPDMVVIGRHRLGKLERWFLGSVAERLLRVLPVPVLIVGEGRDKRIPGAARKQVLAPTDLSEESVYELIYAASLARETNGTVTVLHVIAEPPAGVEFPQVSSEAEIQLELEGFVPRTARRWSTIVTRVESGKPYRKILAAAESIKADLIVMNIHGRGLLERALIGSTAERVIRGSRCPVLAIPPREASRQKRAA
jgi:nucleotide-binding universal stress UspA family protein